MKLDENKNVEDDNVSGLVCIKKDIAFHPLKNVVHT